MAEKTNKIIIEVAGKEYEFASGGGEVPADSVGSEQIKDGSVRTEDLADEVKEGLDELNNVSITDEDIDEIFYPKNGGNDSGDVDGNINDDNDTDGDADDGA